MQRPSQTSYDIVIIGGAIMGASAAWFLTQEPDFSGRILVVERDPSYSACSTAHTTSCIRQQFSTELNIRISQFAADYITNLRAHMGGDPEVPEIGIRSFGYLYLADTPEFEQVLRANYNVQRAAGTATELMTPDQIAQAYPFYNLDDVLLGSINLVNEGYFDSGALFDAWRKGARARGVEFLHNEVVGFGLGPNGRTVERVTLATGDAVSCGQVLNASGPRAARTAAMAGIELPVEPRKRYSWIFKAARPLDRDLPLTIDPSGLHVRENGGGTYQAGGHFGPDPAVSPDDFSVDHDLWEAEVWPILARRIPQFEAIKLQVEWAGHYAMNAFDHNAIMGPHDRVENFFFLNGFSGHGLQQAPAMGRGTAERMVHGQYRTLDLSAFDYARLPAGRRIRELAVI